MLSSQFQSLGVGFPCFVVVRQVCKACHDQSDVRVIYIYSTVRVLAWVHGCMDLEVEGILGVCAPNGQLQLRPVSMASV